MDNNWWDFNTKQFRRFFANNNTIDRHWWDLNTKPVRRFFANSNTYGNAMVGS